MTAEAFAVRQRPLTDREIIVLKGIAEGLTSREQAAALGSALHTIKTHRCKLYKKLRARNAPQAVSIGYQRGLLSAGGRGDDEPCTSGQQRAFHGKTYSLAKLTGQTKKEVEQEALFEISRILNREVTDEVELSVRQMHALLDWIEERLAATGE